MRRILVALSITIASCTSVHDRNRRLVVIPSTRETGLSIRLDTTQMTMVVLPGAADTVVDGWFETRGRFPPDTAVRPPHFDAILRRIVARCSTNEMAVVALTYYDGPRAFAAGSWSIPDSLWRLHPVRTGTDEQKELAALCRGS